MSEHTIPTPTDPSQPPAVAGVLSQRVRVNVARTATRGYTADTTAEVSWVGDPAPALARLSDLLEAADLAARAEIRTREIRDRAQGDGR